MAHLEREVRSLLRPSEHLHFILVGTALLNDLPRTRVPKTGEPSVVLAVVGHVPVGRDVEESGRYMFSTFVQLFCAELLVKVCSYT